MHMYACMCMCVCMCVLTLAGGDVSGLFSKFNSTNAVIWRISRGRLAMRLLLTSNDSSVRQVNSEKKNK